MPKKFDWQKYKWPLIIGGGGIAVYLIVRGKSGDTGASADASLVPLIMGLSGGVGYGGYGITPGGAEIPIDVTMPEPVPDPDIPEDSPPGSTDPLAKRNRYQPHVQ